MVGEGIIRGEKKVSGKGEKESMIQKGWGEMY